MSDNISFNAQTGKHSFFSRGAAWHKLGQNVSEAQTWEQAIQLAGLDWEVLKIQLNHPVTGQPIDTWGTFRSDNNAFFGTVGSVYHPIQNKYQFDFVDSLLEMENGAHYETAGALGNGERVFCLAKIGEGFDVHGLGDKHEVYLLFTTAHDGKGSAKVFLTTVRVVCQNTLRMALTKDGKNALSIRHTRNAEEKLVQAKMLIGAERVNEQELRRKLEILAERKIRRANIEDILTRLFPNDEATNKPTPQALTTMSGILERYEFNDGDAFPEIRGTAYNLVNAFTEYTDHIKPVRVTEERKSLTEGEIRAENALFGKGADFKTSVLDMILDQTKYCETRAIHRPMVSVSGGAQVIELENVMPPKSLLDQILDNTERVAA
jgi:phage/plasmid-like protein (TIGR03299 family)